MCKFIDVLDTTLRDGEQSPGAKCNKEQKLLIAGQLAALKVDVLEAGFPASSRGDLEAVQAVAAAVREPVITGLARAVEKDIDLLWEGIKNAERPRIHIVLGASDIHIQGKFKITRDMCLEMGRAAVRHARKYTADVQYSTEDASRSDFDYLCRVVEEVIKAGATVVNIPDTVGYAVPDEFGFLIGKIRERVPATDKVKMSVHCHNDLGLAVINTLAAVKNGVDQVEVTVNGIGERAGNAALEEVVMALHTRQDFFGAVTRINTRELLATSRIVSEIMNLSVQPNKAIVGANAFAHSSGIHQDGIIKNKNNYQIIDPETVGATGHSLRLTARSGRHAIHHCLQQLGYKPCDQELETIHRLFLEMADIKKEVTDTDLRQIAQSVCN